MSGNTIHHVSNSKEFADDMKKNRSEEGECIMSYEVSATSFTSIPETSAIEIIRNNLEQDTELAKRTTMSANNILRAVGILFM